MSGKRRTIAYIINKRGCHICTSHIIGTQGYPFLWKNGRDQNMHRVLYEEAYGPLTPGLVVRHNCDDTHCINLNHLISGTRTDNTNDMIKRGRANPPHGERSGTAKLTRAKVSIIRRSKCTQDLLAARYNVNQSTISRIRSGEGWIGVN